MNPLEHCSFPLHFFHFTLTPLNNLRGLDSPKQSIDSFLTLVPFQHFGRGQMPTECPVSSQYCLFIAALAWLSSAPSFTLHPTNNPNKKKASFAVQISSWSLLRNSLVSVFIPQSQKCCLKWREHHKLQTESSDFPDVRLTPQFLRFWIRNDPVVFPKGNRGAWHFLGFGPWLFSACSCY